MTGGFQEPVQRIREDRRQSWFDAYLTTILDRDIRDIAQIQDFASIPRLLRLLAARTAGLYNRSEISRSSTLSNTTLGRYMALLEMTFLIHFLRRERFMMCRMHTNLFRGVVVMMGDPVGTHSRAPLRNPTNPTTIGRIRNGDRDGMTNKKKQLIRNSTAEFLIFTGQSGEQSIEARYEDETIWLSQKLLAVLFDVDVRTINEHLKNIYAQQELSPEATIRKFRIVQKEGKRDVSREVDFTIIYTTSVDYNKDAPTTRIFFAKVQNKLHYAIHGNTAAELIFERANSTKPNMGLITWEKAPDGKILKTDVTIAKNYLSKEELESLGRIVNAYLDLAEDRARRRIPMTMEDWSKRLDMFLEFDDREILQDKGKISAELAKTHAETEFEKFRIFQDRLFESDFDKALKQIESGLAEKRRKSAKPADVNKDKL